MIFVLIFPTPTFLHAMMSHVPANLYGRCSKLSRERCPNTQNTQNKTVLRAVCHVHRDLDEPTNGSRAKLSELEGDLQDETNFTGKSISIGISSTLAGLFYLVGAQLSENIIRN